MTAKKAAKAAAAPVASTSSARPADSSLSTAKSAWSHDGAFYAHLNPAVDTHTVRIYAASGSGRCLARWASITGETVHCLTWLQLPSPSVAADAEKRGKKRRKVDDDDNETVDDDAPTHAVPPQTALALGLDDGTVLLVHPTTSAVICKLEDPSGMPSAVTALDCSPRLPSTDAPHLLWTADELGVLRAFALGPSHGTLYGRAKGAGPGYGSALAVRYPSPAVAHVLVARFDIRSLEITLESAASLDLAQIARFAAAGHTSEVATLRWLDTGAHFTSAAHGDRTLNLWSDNGDLVALTTLDDPVQSLDVRDGLIAAVNRQGGASIVSWQGAFSAPNRSTSHRRKVTPLAISCRIGPDVRAMKLESPTSVRVAKGSALKPTFESVTFRAEGSGDVLPDIQLAPASKSLLVDEDGDVTMGAVRRDRVDWVETALISSKQPISRSAYKEGTSAVRSAAFAADESSAVVNQGDLDVETAGPTLAQRMKSLKIPQPPELAGDEDVERAKAIVPQATLAQTLIQALHSDDRELIEACLNHVNPKLIRATVKRLPTSLVLPLVDSLVDRLSRGKRGYGAGAQRGRALVVWLRTCLVVHVGYLVTVQGLSDRLATFQAALHQRLEAHNQLLSLSGRLELVVSQIELRREAAGRPRADLAYEAMVHQKGDPSAAMVAKPPPPVPKYVEGESESSASSDDDDEAFDDSDEFTGIDIEGGDGDDDDDEDIEDIALGMHRETSSSDGDADDGLPNQSTLNGGHRQPRVNGFLDLEVEEGSGSDESETDSTDADSDSDSEEDLDDADDD